MFRDTTAHGPERETDKSNPKSNYKSREGFDTELPSNTDLTNPDIQENLETELPSPQYVPLFQDKASDVGLQPVGRK